MHGTAQHPEAEGSSGLSHRHDDGKTVNEPRTLVAFKLPTRFFSEFSKQADGLNARDAYLEVERPLPDHDRSRGRKGMNPFVAWLSLIGLGVFRACDCGAFRVVAP